jgi:ribosome maturation factor RimP
MSITHNITELAQPVVESYGYYLLDVNLVPKGRKECWVVIDHETTGVDVDDCSKISKELALLMEAHESIEDAYILNITSPGLDRPLTDPRQFLKNKGRTVRVELLDSEHPDGDAIEVQGILKNYTEEGVQLTVTKGNKSEDLPLIPHSIIQHVYVTPSFR